MQTDTIHEVSDAVASGRWPFLKNTDRAYALIRAGIVPAIRVGRRYFLSESQLTEFCARGGKAEGSK